MDYFEGVVADYLSADRAVFVNPQCRIQLEPCTRPKKGEHWYCDILAIDFRESAVYLCEVTLSRTVSTLLRRLRDWNANWPEICAAVHRDSHIPEEWDVRPRVFVPKAQMGLVRRKVEQIVDSDGEPPAMPKPEVTSLESVTPWQYATSRRGGTL